MRRQVNGRAYWLACISTGRPQAVEAMAGHLGGATWYTRPTDAYGDVRVEGLSAARNRALVDAFELGLPCVQVSDDLKGVKRLEPDGQVIAIHLVSALGDMLEALFAGHARLAGVAPTANPFYARRRLAVSHFCVGDLIAVRPSAPRFDEALPLKEDYDFTCQHLASWGAVARCDWLLANFAHRSNRGGAVDVRTVELEQAAIERLKARWPQWIADNPRRANEVLLRCSLSAA